MVTGVNCREMNELEKRASGGHIIKVRLYKHILEVMIRNLFVKGFFTCAIVYDNYEQKNRACQVHACIRAGNHAAGIYPGCIRVQTVWVAVSRLQPVQTGP